MIRNRDQLIMNGLDDATLKLRGDACTILEAALEAVDPENAIYNAIKLEDQSLSYRGGSIDLLHIKTVIVIGGGKAGGLMSKAVENLLENRIASGLVNVLEGTEQSVSLQHVQLNGANHPIPSESGVKGVKIMLELTRNLSETDLVIALISGGGSALMPYPAEGISLDDLQEMTGQLLKAGATINELNAVRKHLSGFKGGQLARHCSPARVLSLILSDVIDDHLDIIASGPTVPDSSSFSDAKIVLEKYDLWDCAQDNIKTRITKGLSGNIPDTPKKYDPVFDKVHNILIANNPIAAEAAKKRAESLGYNSMILSTSIEGEARTVGERLSKIAKEITEKDKPVKKPAAVIIGGETTVTVIGNGKGGRNQELAMGAASGLVGLSCVVATLGTDGIDGPTEAAGAIVDGYTIKRSKAKNLDLTNFLRENNSYHYFDELGDYILTGPTGTNVNDLAIILVK